VTELSVQRYAHPDARRTFRAAAHPALELGWIERGRAEYRIGAAVLVPPPRAVVVVPPGVEHTTTFDPGLIARSIWIAEPMARALADGLGMAVAPDPCVVHDGAPVIAIADAVAHELARPRHAQPLVLDALAEALVAAVLRAGPPRPITRDPRIARAVELVHARLADPLTVGDLAAAAGMSRFHFSRAFRAALGVSPYRFVQDARLARARELLQASRRSVTEVALSVGFSDLGRFAAAFRARYGVPPSSARSAGRSARIA
jgi:AraC family transcriptional regulator